MDTLYSILRILAELTFPTMSSTWNGLSMLSSSISSGSVDSTAQTQTGAFIGTCRQCYGRCR
eukprot:scaffold2691_cov417-Prasinococcus_capsulatus_cf.AAC.19